MLAARGGVATAIEKVKAHCQLPPAQGIESLVDGMLYFPGCSAGDCGFTTAFLNVVADGFAVVALVTEHLFRIGGRPPHAPPIANADTTLLVRGNRGGTVVCGIRTSGLPLTGARVTRLQRAVVFVDSRLE